MLRFHSLALACCGVALLADLTPAIAQERSAAKTVETPLSWDTLQASAVKLNHRTDEVNQRVQAVITCNKKFKDYAPGALGADADGCIENQLIKQLTTRMDAVEQAIVDTNARTAELNTRAGVNIARVDASVVALSQRIDILAGRVNVVESDLKTLHTAVTQLGAQVMSLNNKIDSVTAALDSRVNALNAKIDANQADMNKKVATANSRLTSELASINAAVKDINDKIADLTGRTNDLYTRTNDIYAKNAAVASRVANIENCGRNNMMFNSNVGCVRGPAAPAPNCRLDVAFTTAVWNHNHDNLPPNCPSGYAMMGANGGGDFSIRYCARILCN